MGREKKKNSNKSILSFSKDLDLNGLETLDI